MADAKEQARIDEMLKTLRREEANKRCNECDERGPSYVDIDHSTFVCTTCGGILREFSFRVKGLTMAVFTAEEVKALGSGGGNAGSRRVWLANFDPNKPRDAAKIPSPGDKVKIRDFIREKYVNKKWVARRDSRAGTNTSADGSDSMDERPPPKPYKPSVLRRGSTSQSEDDAADFRSAANDAKTPNKPRPVPQSNLLDTSFDDFVQAPGGGKAPDLLSGGFSAGFSPFGAASNGAEDDGFSDFKAASPRETNGVSASNSNNNNLLAGLSFGAQQQQPQARVDDDLFSDFAAAPAPTIALQPQPPPAAAPAVVDAFAGLTAGFSATTSFSAPMSPPAGAAPPPALSPLNTSVKTAAAASASPALDVFASVSPTTSSVGGGGGGAAAAAAAPLAFSAPAPAASTPTPAPPLSPRTIVRLVQSRPDIMQMLVAMSVAEKNGVSHQPPPQAPPPTTTNNNNNTMADLFDFS